ncbi:hypothetical protein HS041_36055 [Planomonospora sp. ID67723]|uniref:hypothetical protein n=1 Tax=Planomonospora sp. ID67723 TaxID=2738134 RepID=UPI0018C42CE4|nr:hypothetical protein [Planomonospora sp. ID67723]MBG0833121.1 hypothetical protein [Planomonospora sp. ID67723]
MRRKLLIMLAASPAGPGSTSHAGVISEAPQGGLWAVSLAIFVLGVIVVVLFLHRFERRLEQIEDPPRERLGRRIAAVNAAFTEAARLMDELQRDLAAQQAAREAIIAQAEEQQRLLEINQEQAEKIRHILVGETKATIRAERRQQWLFFALGAAMSVPIGVAINLLVP